MKLYPIIFALLLSFHCSGPVYAFSPIKSTAKFIVLLPFRIVKGAVKITVGAVTGAIGGAARGAARGVPKPHIDPKVKTFGTVLMKAPYKDLLPAVL